MRLCDLKYIGDGSEGFIKDPIRRKDGKFIDIYRDDGKYSVYLDDNDERWGQTTRIARSVGPLEAQCVIYHLLQEVDDEIAS